MKKAKSVILILAIILISSSCVSSLFVAGTKPTYFYQDEYSSTAFVEKSISLPLQGSGWWAIVIRQLEESTAFILDTHTPDWYFFESMDVVIDDETMHFDSVSNDRQVVSTAVSEWVVFSVPYSFIEKIASSSIIKIRFNGSDGRKEFDLSGEKFKVEVKEFLEYMKANNPF